MEIELTWNVWGLDWVFENGALTPYVNVKSPGNNNFHTVWHVQYWKTLPAKLYCKTAKSSTGVYFVISVPQPL